MRWSSRGRRAGARWTLAAVSAASCGHPSHPPEYDPVDYATSSQDASSRSSSAAADSACTSTATSADPSAEGYCGNEFLDATGPAPNVYFVLDRSGSMADVVSGQTKYARVASAVTDLVKSLGARVNVGAAVFPKLGADGTATGIGCDPGLEVFATQAGDTADSALCLDSPVTRGLAQAIALPRLGPNGGTPTAATLRSLTPTLKSLAAQAKTFVVLATDGGPNCNANTTCDSASCIPNIEHTCDASTDCCKTADYGPTSCLDSDAAVDAVGQLLLAGIRTFVIGIPGSAPYAAVLDRLARAGGTARDSTAAAAVDAGLAAADAGLAAADVGAPDAGGTAYTAYYDVPSLDELDSVLSTVGAEVLLSCELTLTQVPPDLTLVNVYLDQQRVPYGGADGWVWAGDAAPPSSSSAYTVELLGAACAELESGTVRSLRIVSGCPTEIAR